MTGRPPPERVEGFGGYNFSVSAVHRPDTVEELAETLASLRRERRSIVLRGLGRSYGDAPINPGGDLVELTRLRRVLSFDETSGTLTAEPGVTFEDLWRLAVPRGFWPPVVPGTMYVTLGGAVAMNVHGKNGYHAGTLGDHVESLEVLDSEGRRRRVDRADPELRTVIGRWGSPEPIVAVSLRLKRVPSGFLDVESIPTRHLVEMLDLLEERKERDEYLVGWVDCLSRGSLPGGGVVHAANYHVPAAGEPLGLTVEEQVAATGLAGRLPKGLLLFGLRAFTNDPGMRLVNTAKNTLHRLGGVRRYRQSLVAFSFLLDFVPGWRDVYRPGGFIQYQLFVPAASARDVFSEALRRQRELGVFSYLGVVKRHRADGFAGAYACDGFSLALDFPVTERGAPGLIALCRGYDRLLASCGGRNYKAKDCVGSLPRALVG